MPARQPERPFLDGVTSLGPAEDVRPLWEQRAAERRWEAERREQRRQAELAARWSRTGPRLSLGRAAGFIGGLGFCLATLRGCAVVQRSTDDGSAALVAFLGSLTSGPLFGFFLQRRLGGGGVTGAALGGAVWWCVLDLQIYARQYLDPVPNAMYPSPEISIPLFLAIGSSIGFLNGLILRALLGPPITRRSSTPGVRVMSS